MPPGVDCSFLSQKEVGKGGGGGGGGGGRLLLIRAWRPEGAIKLAESVTDISLLLLSFLLLLFFFVCTVEPLLEEVVGIIRVTSPLESFVIKDIEIKGRVQHLKHFCRE